MNIFSINKNSEIGIAGKVLEQKKDDKKIDNKKIEYVLSKTVIEPEKINFDIFYKENDYDCCLNIFFQILTISLSFFSNIYYFKEYQFGKESILHIYRLARAFHKTPIEILSVNGDYNSLDAFLFNSFVGTEGINWEIRQKQTNHICIF
ncbi:MAG: hypothetical protein ACFFE4_00450 [Candidatus Thorarchaeota archaeon]